MRGRPDPRDPPPLEALDEDPASAESRAAYALARATSHISHEFTAADMIDVLRAAQAKDGDGESMLFYQGQVLDTLFHRLAGQCTVDASYTCTSQLDLALRTQRQCRSALYSLAYVKYMKKKK